MSDHLLKEWPSEKICILRLNRPKKYNALSRALVGDLRAAVAALPDTRAQVAILAANGPGFCAGADLKERATMSDDEKFAHNRAINALANEVAALPMATIAMIGGVAMGGGCELSLACDIRFISESAVIGLTEARIGAIPGAGGTQRLPRVIGIPRALEMMYSGEPVTAAQAGDWGLVNAVLPPGDLESHTIAYAEKVASRSRRTGACLKDVVYRGMGRDIAGGLEIEGEAIADILASDDYREGLAAFAERRPPVFN